MSASSDYLSVLSDISRAKAAATSEAARQNGQIWGNTIANIGQIVAQYPEQQARMKEIANRAALTDLEKQREQRIAANEQRQQQAQQAATEALAQLQKTPDGLWDVNDAMSRLGTTGLDPAHVESFTTGLQKLNDMTVAERKRQEDANADRAHSFLSIYKGDEPITPESMSFNAEALKGIGGMTDADAQAIHDITQSVPPGTDLRPLLKAIEQKSEKYKPKYATAPEGSTIYDQTTGQTAGIPAPKKPKTWAEMGLDAQDPNSPTQAASTAALAAHTKLTTPKAVSPGTFEDYIIKKYGAEATPEQILEGRKAYGQADDRPSVTITQQNQDAKDVVESVKGMKDGTIPPILPSRASREYGAIMAEAHRQGVNLVKLNEDWNATQKYLSTLNGQQQTRLRQAVAFTKESLPVVESLAKQWDAGRFPILNAANLKLAKNGAYGQPAQSLATKLDAQIADLTSELGTVYKGGNSSTDESLALAAKNLQSDWSKQTMLDNIAQIRQNLTIREHSMQLGQPAGVTNNQYAPGAPTASDPLGIRR